MTKKPARLPLIVIFGDDLYQRSTAVTQTLDELLPPPVDRGLALCTYDGGRSVDQGGPEMATVREDLATLPFLSDRRVVLIRDADAFISAQRDRLEATLAIHRQGSSESPRSAR